MKPRHRLRIGRGHLLDVHAALGAHHSEMPAHGPVEGEGGVVLGFDARHLLHPHLVHQVSLDVHAEDGLGVVTRLLRRCRHLDAARLAAPSHLHLGLDHHRRSQLFGSEAGLVGRVGGSPIRYRHPDAGEQGLPLVLEQIHRPLLVSARGCAPPPIG